MTASVKPERPVRPVDAAEETITRVVGALAENARLAQVTMLAIDQYVETAVRFLSVSSGGPEAVRRRATAFGLYRLEAHLSHMSGITRQPLASLAVEREITLERSPGEDPRC